MSNQTNKVSFWVGVSELAETMGRMEFSINHAFAKEKSFVAQAPPLDASRPLQSSLWSRNGQHSSSSLFNHLTALIPPRRLLLLPLVSVSPTNNIWEWSLDSSSHCIVCREGEVH
jgi:hypothetical protein